MRREEKRGERNEVEEGRIQREEGRRNTTRREGEREQEEQKRIMVLGNERNGFEFDTSGNNSEE